MEAVISCSSSDSNTLIWDPNSGAPLKTLRGNTTEPGGVTVRKPYNNQLYAVQNTRQLMLSWDLGKEQSIHKSVTPEKMLSLTTTNDGLYALGGSVSGIIYIWNMNNGTLLTSLPIHFKGVKCLAVTEDDSLVLSGGEDGVVTVMLFGKMFGTATGTSMTTHPSILHTLTHHSLPVTSISTGGAGGTLSRFISTSLDHSLKLYDLPTGRILLSLLFPSALLCSTWDLAERTAFVGGSDGRIFSVWLDEGKEGEKEIKTEKEEEEGEGRRELLGHTGAVVSLDMSLDGGMVVSGSVDRSVCVWDVGSGGLLKSFKGHKGPVSFAKFCLLPNATFTTTHTNHSTTTTPSTLLQKFHYSLGSSVSSSSSSDDPFQAPALLSLSSSSPSGGDKKRKRERKVEVVEEGDKMKKVKEENERLKEENENLEEELKKWKKACEDLVAANEE